MQIHWLNLRLQGQVAQTCRPSPWVSIRSSTPLVQNISEDCGPPLPQGHHSVSKPYH
jgi:hypothetical protein